MREFYELVNEYPWTTVLLFIGICIILSLISGVMNKTINIISYEQGNSEQKNLQNPKWKSIYN